MSAAAARHTLETQPHTILFMAQPHAQIPVQLVSTKTPLPSYVFSVPLIAKPAIFPQRIAPVVALSLLALLSSYKITSASRPALLDTTAIQGLSNARPA